MLNNVIKNSINLAEKNVDTIMPGFTHLKECTS